MDATRAPRERSSAWQRAAALTGAVGLLLATIALAKVVTDDDPAGPEILSAEEAIASGNPTIELGEMFIEGDLAVDAGATVTVVNGGATAHNLAIEGGPRTPDLTSDQAAELDLALVAPGIHAVFCTIEGHRAAGMEEQLAIGEGGSS